MRHLYSAADIAEMFDVPIFFLEPTVADVEEQRRQEYQDDLSEMLADSSAHVTEIGHREGWLPPGTTIRYST